MEFKTVSFEEREGKIAFILKDEMGSEVYVRSFLSDRKIILFDFPNILDWVFEICDTTKVEALKFKDKIEYLYFDSFPINSIPKIVPGIIVGIWRTRTFNTDTNQEDVSNIYPQIKDKILKRLV